MNYTTQEIASSFKQELCQRVSYDASLGDDMAEMVVSWKVSHNKYAEAVAFLDVYGVGDNVSAPSLVLSSPVVDHEAYAGFWRIVRNFYDAKEGAGQVFQVRRKGWLQSVVDGNDLAWDEGRLISGRDHTVFKVTAGQTDDYCVWQWRNVNPVEMPTMVKAMVDLADGGSKTFSVFGTAVGGHADWRLLPPEYKRESDGSGTITAAFVRFGVALRDYGSIGSEIQTESVQEQVAEDQAQARIATLKSTANVVNVSSSRAATAGIVQISYTVRKVGKGSFTYTVQRGAAQVEHHYVAWGMGLTGAGVIEGLDWVPTTTPATPAANVVRSVSGVAYDKASGTYSYRIMVSDEAPGFFEYETTREVGDSEYHRVAWEQGTDTLGLLGILNTWLPSGKGLTLANSIRSVGSVQRNPVTGRFSYHIVVSARGNDIPIHPASPLTSYRYREERRSMWSIANNMYWDQQRLVQVQTQILQFTSFEAAEAWIWENSGAGGVIIIVDGVPTNMPAFVMVDTPMPRKVAKNRWLASRSYESTTFDWYPTEPGS